MECDLVCFGGACQRKLDGEWGCVCSTGWEPTPEMLWYDQRRYNEGCVLNRKLLYFLLQILEWSSVITFLMMGWILYTRWKAKKLGKNLLVGIFSCMLMCLGSWALARWKVGDMLERGVGLDLFSSMLISFMCLACFVSSDVSLLKKFSYLRKILRRVSDRQLESKLKLIRLVLIPVCVVTALATNLLWLAVLLPRHQTNILRLGLGVSSLGSLVRMVLILRTANPVLKHMRELLNMTTEGQKEMMIVSNELRRRIKFAIRATSMQVKVLAFVAHFPVVLFDLQGFLFPQAYRVYIYFVPFRCTIAVISMMVSAVFSIFRAQKKGRKGMKKKKPGFRSENAKVSPSPSGEDATSLPATAILSSSDDH